MWNRRLLVCMITGLRRVCHTQQRIANTLLSYDSQFGWLEAFRLYHYVQEDSLGSSERAYTYSKVLYSIYIDNSTKSLYWKTE